jgi:UDPglucose 6-dehydrogenase
MRLGVIGCGVVGSAVVHGFSEKGVDDIAVYDPIVYPESQLSDVLGADIVFVCVPTPTSKTSYAQDTNILVVTLDALEANKYKGIVAIKSTTLPENIARFAKEYKNLRLVTNPEFLTAEKAKEDFLHQSFVVVGGNAAACRDAVGRLYKKYWPAAVIHTTNLPEAMLIKYIINCMLATRVTLMNEIYIAHKESDMEIDWEKVIAGVSCDYRSGRSHMSVPGPDGKLGYGGMCFPKEVRAMLTFVEHGDVSGLHLLRSVDLQNNLIRGEE